MNLITHLITTLRKVAITRKANIYFNGGVSSQTITIESGKTKTLDMMRPGEYQFSTDKKEIMEIQLGEADALLPDKTERQRFVSGDSF